MTSSIEISDVHFAAASGKEVSSGLVGYISAVLNDSLWLDGLTLRQTADGRLTLSYPARKDSRGRQWSYLKPMNDTVRREVEAQVLKALGFGSVTS